MRITFHGGTGEVTGSCYAIETDSVRFLVDCGMFQGDRDTEKKNRRPFAFLASSVDFVLLTHAHVDHSGLLPKLCKEGFAGPIHTTEATAELLAIMLRDSAYIHEQAARRAKRSGGGSREERTPLYTSANAAVALTQTMQHPYDEVFHPHRDVRVRMRDAGHILGSAILEIWVRSGDRETKLVFSGDLGQPGRPILRDPQVIEEADYLIIESTYGDRLHKALGPSLDELLAITRKTLYEKQGNLIIPAFAVGRSQELIYYFQQLTRRGELHDLSIFLDSPMAQRVTKLTMKHLELFDAEARQLETWHAASKSSMTLKFTDAQESRELNDISSGAIIISASGMCTAGRILHHLRHGLPHKRNTVLITGYQARGTLGRRLVDGEPMVRIFGHETLVKADLHVTSGFSAHADREALLQWASGFRIPPRRTFVTHGEPEPALALKEALSGELGHAAEVPLANTCVELGGNTDIRD